MLADAPRAGVAVKEVAAVPVGFTPPKRDGIAGAVVAAPVIELAVASIKERDMRYTFKAKEKNVVFEWRNRDGELDKLFFCFTFRWVFGIPVDPSRSGPQGEAPKTRRRGSRSGASGSGSIL